MLYQLVIVMFLGSSPEYFVVDYDLTREDCASIITEGIEYVEWKGKEQKLDPNTTIYACEPMNKGFSR